MSGFGINVWREKDCCKLGVHCSADAIGWKSWRTERETVTAEIRRVREEAWLCERLTEAFGRDGIQALIMENTLPEIEEEANAILARLTDNRIQITIESLRDLKERWYQGDDGHQDRR